MHDPTTNPRRHSKSKHQYRTCDIRNLAICGILFLKSCHAMFISNFGILTPCACINRPQTLETARSISRSDPTPYAIRRQLGPTHQE